MSLKNKIFSISDYCNGYFMSTFFSAERLQLHRFLRDYSHLVEVICDRKVKIFRLRSYFNNTGHGHFKANKNSVVLHLLTSSFLIDLEEPVIKQGHYLKIQDRLYYPDYGNEGGHFPKKEVRIVTSFDCQWAWRSRGYEVIVPPKFNSKMSIFLIRSFLQSDDNGVCPNIAEDVSTVSRIDIDDYFMHFEP